MMERIAEASPRLKARVAGVLYLINIVVGGFAVFVRFALVVRSDAAATARVAIVDRFDSHTRLIQSLA